LTAPAIKIDDEKLNFINVQLSPILSRVFPRVWFPEGVPVEKLSRSVEAQQTYLDDPLCLTSGYLRIRSGCETMLGSFYAQEHAHEVTTPFLILHGTADDICDIKGSELLLEKAASKDKTMIRMEGTRSTWVVA